MFFLNTGSSVPLLPTLQYKFLENLPDPVLTIPVGTEFLKNHDFFWVGRGITALQILAWPAPWVQLSCCSCDVGASISTLSSQNGEQYDWFVAQH